MFTSRAEYRLLLREDNADFRLRDIGRRLGLVGDDVYRSFCRKRDRIEGLLTQLAETKIRPDSGILDRLRDLGSSPIRNSTPLSVLLRRNEISFDSLALFDPGLKGTPVPVAEEVEARIKYRGYIERQERQVARLQRMEGVRIPDAMDYDQVHGLTSEVREKLSRVRPVSLGQASRISGVTPAALMAMEIFLKKLLLENE
jgi:tRNA uridine 5-carboxymethylaminomethyl modification enzyme